MEPDLSEFSFGFALTSELINKMKLKAAGAPMFATQNAEAKAGGGWDVELPKVAIYLQFKRCDEMTRRSALESDLFVTLPFYRMHLRRRDVSRQHQLMLDLENSGKQVLYAAPGFSTMSRLSQCYSSDTVTKNSIFVRPSSIGALKDDKKHHIAFQLGKKAYFCSEPKEIRPVDIDELLAALTVAGSDETISGKAEAPDFFEREAEVLLKVFEKKAGAAEREISARVRELRQRRSSADYAAQVAMTLFEAEMLVVPAKKGGRK